MKPITLIAALILAFLAAGCSRKEEVYQPHVNGNVTLTIDAYQSPDVHRMTVEGKDDHGQTIRFEFTRGEPSWWRKIFD